MLKKFLELETILFFISKILDNFFINDKFWVCEKYSIIEDTAFGPRPSILASTEVLSDSETKLSIFLNSLANISALISPIKRIPREYINLSKSIVLDLSIEDIKFLTDKEPQPSRFSIIFLFFSNKKISAILLIIFKS